MIIVIIISNYDCDVLKTMRYVMTFFRVYMQIRLGIAKIVLFLCNMRCNIRDHTTNVKNEVRRH